METSTLDTITGEERERFDPLVGSRADELAAKPSEYWWQVEVTSRIHVKNPFTPEEERSKYHRALRYAVEKQGFNTSQG